VRVRLVVQARDDVRAVGVDARAIVSRAEQVGEEDDVCVSGVPPQVLDEPRAGHDAGQPELLPFFFAGSPEATACTAFLTFGSPSLVTAGNRMTSTPLRLVAPAA